MEGAAKQVPRDSTVIVEKHSKTNLMDIPKAK
jgi:hypothetical protein